MSRGSPASPQRTRLRAAVRHTVASLCVLAALLPAAAGAADDPRERLDDVNNELGTAREGLRHVEERKSDEMAELEVVEARQAKLRLELDALDAELDAAQGELDERAVALAETTAELAETERRLRETRNRLLDQRALFGRRARASYIYGGNAAISGILLDAGSLAEFDRGMKYARALLDADKEVVERIGALELTIERDTVELGKLADRREAQRAVAETERDRVATIVDRRSQVAEQVAAEAQRRQELVARLEADRKAYVAMVTDLELEGAKLEGELRRLAEEQRRREAALERRRARAAAARQAAATVERAAPAPPATSAGDFLWPANGPKTSDFGWRTHPIFGTGRFHAGIDIGAASGSPIYAADSGVVVSTGVRGGYGNTVVIDHGGGLATLYAHQSSIGVSDGQTVSRGQVIGAVGSTGYSTGPHLHFEVRENGVAVDPMRYF